MVALKDLVGPCHADWKRRSKSEPDHQKTAISSPRLRTRSKGGCQKASYLNAYRSTEQDCSMVMKTVEYRCN